MEENKLSITYKIINISKEVQDKITLWMNHLLVVYAFLIPINGKAKTSVFFCILLLFLYRRNYIEYLKISFKNDVVKYFLLLYLVFVIGMFYTDDISSGNAFMDKAKQLLFPLLFLSFLDIRFSFRILNAFIIGVFVSEVVSYLIHFEIIPPQLYVGTGKIYKTVVEDPSPFLNHIKHNIALAIVISILIYKLLVKDIENIYLKILSLIFIMTAFINMSLIGGRTGYIVLFILIFLVSFLVYKDKLKKFMFISLSIFIIMFVYMYNFSEQFSNRINHAKKDIEKIIEQKNYNSSLGLRIIGSYYSLEIIKDNFFLGVGTGDVMKEIGELSKKEHPYIVKSIKAPHNVYLQVFAQVGFIGFSLMILMFYKILRYKTNDKNKDDMIKIITIASLIFMLPGNFFDFFELSMFVTMISAMVCNNNFNINIKDINYKDILIYTLICFIFLVIGVTK